MAVITTDILIEGIRRDDVLDWLGDRGNHARLVSDAFDGCKELAPGEFELTIKAPPHARALKYAFDHVDTEHQGRRVHVKTAGRRLDGSLHYSLRTMKPSLNTMVTLHHDFDSGVLGGLVEQFGLRKKLEEGWKKVLANLQREMAAKR